MLTLECNCTAGIVGAQAVLRSLHEQIVAQAKELCASWRGERVSGNIAMHAVSLNKELAPLQAFAAALLNALAAADGTWPHEVQGYLVITMKSDDGTEFSVDVLEHRWTGDLLARMDCGFDAATMERCVNSARQRLRF